MVEVKFCHKFSQNVSWRKLDQPYALLCMLCNYDNPVTDARELGGVYVGGVGPITSQWYLFTER